MKRQSGFTLIELVVVIVILGILAVTAAPRFLNIQGDAKKSTLEGMKGALQGASGIVYGKSAILGKEKEPDSTINDGSQVIDVVYGYPAATAGGIAKTIENSSGDWSFDYETVASAAVVTIKNTTASDDVNKKCQVEYLAATGPSASPSIQVYSAGC